MAYTRRDVLIGGAAVAAACTTDAPLEPPPAPAPERDPSPSPPVLEGAASTDVFPWGVVIAEATGGSALVRVRAVDAVWCALVVQRSVEGAWVEVQRMELHHEDFTFRGVLENLEGESTYVVWAETEGARSGITRFRTAPTGVERRKVRFGATSCLATFNEEMRNLSFVGEHDLDLFLMLGDAVYADGSYSREDYQASWTEHFRRPVMGELFAATSVVSIWDDHEVGNNWTLLPNRPKTITEEQLLNAKVVMDQVLPQRRGPAGFYRTHRWGEDVEFFLFDCRGERNDERMVSPEQLEWMTDRLLASSARFKIVLSSVHLTDHYLLLNTIQEEDRWQGFPEQRAALISTLAAVPGAFVLTGDMHFGSVQALDPEGIGRSLTEVAVGPSGSFLLPVDSVVDLICGTPEHYALLLEDWSWTRFDLDPNTGAVAVAFIGDGGSVLASHVFVV